VLERDSSCIDFYFVRWKGLKMSSREESKSLKFNASISSVVEHRAKFRRELIGVVAKASL
jgi:hypothetical protein